MLCISVLLISQVEEVTEGDGADEIEVYLRGVVVEMIEKLFVRLLARRVDCVLGH